jgi:hypothetical protein
LGVNGDRRRIMKVIRNASVLCVALLCGHTLAQISEDQAILAAKEYVTVLAPEVLGALPVVERETMEVRGNNFHYFRISFERTREVKVCLHADGTFLSYGDIRSSSFRPKGDHPDKYPTDEAAWHALEDVVAALALDLPQGLERFSVKRMGGNGGDVEHGDYVYMFYMRPRPYGYERCDGNYLAAEIHRITGRVLSLSVARGWTYEVPNIQLAPGQAVAKAILVFGGEPSEWRTTIGYHSVAYDRAPAYVRQMVSDQVMRLTYIASSARGHVKVDSVTGAVMDTWQLDAVGHTGARTDAPIQENVGETVGRHQDVTSGTTRSRLASGPGVKTIALGIVAALVAVGGVALLARRARVRE